MQRKWFKIFDNIHMDQTLAVVAHRCACSMADVMGLWVYLHALARQSTPTGSIASLDIETASVTLGLSPAHIASALDCLREKKYVAKDNRLSAWDIQQETSALRVRKHRARKSIVTPKSIPASNIRHDDPAAVAARRARIEQTRQDHKTAQNQTPLQGTRFIPSS